MVATKGRGWALASSLVSMEAEADRIAPKRSRLSDGSIGDQAHATRTSGHNPSLRRGERCDRRSRSKLYRLKQAAGW